ncbi:MAG: SLC13 family permease [bacterium]|nr:SLC13 family permease [bacterium]
MGFDGWLTLGVLVLMVAAMVREVAGPDLIAMAGLFALAVTGVLTPEETFSGFANPAMATVGALFIVSAGLRETGLLEAAVVRLFGRARGETSALTRMCPPLAGFSAFLNNAPIVAMMTPVVIEWARRRGHSPSRFLIPLSYSTILGSLLTVIGTSVNLTVAGLIVQTDMPAMGFFELLPVGLPVCLAGLAYIIFIAPHLIPARQDLAQQLGDRRREYTAAMRVEAGSQLAGETVEEAGLRQLPGLFLIEIDRDGRTLTPVAPEEVLREGDRLVFAGAVATIVDLQRFPGLVADTDDAVAADSEASRERRLIEAVISSSSPLRGQSVRDANFRTTFDAAVVAVHRNGERVGGKIGEIVLRPGDTLLLQTATGFMRAHGNSPDFFLVSEIGGHVAHRTEKAGLAIAILVGMVGVAAVGILPISIASFVAVGALIGTRCIDGRIARQSVEWNVLVVIGAGLGIALAMEKTGAAGELASLLVGGTGSLGPWVTLAAVYLVTVLLSEFLHHNAAVAIMFPIAIQAASQVGADPRGFIMAIAMGANCAFANPVTYQTHLIVYGPGGYRFTDFVRAGLPLDLLCAAVALTVIPWVWPLG